MAFKISEQGIAMGGFSELNAALRRVEGGRGNFGLEYELQKRLREIGETIAKSAPGFVTHNTGRHGNTGLRLEDSVKVSVAATSASVYSTAVHGGAQNSGAGPHAGWAARGPHIQKDRASRWMTKAVNSKRAFVQAEMEGLVDWVVEEFERQI